ncbi:MAG TPA: cytochrome c biogenesis protein CcdA [Armatimonadota bacterium]|nr:cytochrome c biogenesis protein CcdA [Armatimonadota bacterium]
MNDVTYLAALGAGVASFASPCVLPLVPAYLSFISGASLEDVVARRRDAVLARAVTVRAVAFVLGFSTVFVALGASATALGGFLGAHLPILAKIAGGLVILFGLHLTGLVPIKALYRERRVQVTGKPVGLAGAFVVGLAFAFGWTPCVGPILASILALAGTRESVASGVALLGVYSLGLGLPFIAAGVAVNWFLALSNRVKRWARAIEVGTGVLLIVVGVLIMTGGFDQVTMRISRLGGL